MTQEERTDVIVNLYKGIAISILDNLRPTDPDQFCDMLHSCLSSLQSPSIQKPEIPVVSNPE